MAFGGQIIRLRPAALSAGAVGVASTGAVAVGAFALGALAMGAVAIGALAIGRLSIGRLRLRQARIDRLSVGQLEVDGEPVELVRRGSAKKVKKAKKSQLHALPAPAKAVAIPGSGKKRKISQQYQE